ncbi:MAG: AI-2E family transporter [Syntrophales bacterium]|nr:AI-2E family transporter [Syntrophales bacterium]
MNAPKINLILFFTLFGIAAVLFIYLLKPFFFPLFWATVIAAVFNPLYKRLNAKIKRPNVSAAIMLLVVTVIIILPVSVIGSLLISESLRIYDALSRDSSYLDKSIQKIIDVMRYNSYLDRLDIKESFWTEKFSEIARGIADYIFVHIRSLTQNTLVFIVKFAVMFYSLFFFIRDGDKFLRTLLQSLPLENDVGEKLYKRFTDTTRAALKATLIIGGLQGTLGGLVFFVAGIEGALFWGIVMVVSSLVPGIGCSIIWGPAGIIMLLTGHTWEGLLILIFGSAVISMVDNLLRPVLIGRDVQLHPLLIFLSSLGGIALYGISGFVIGPIIASLFITIWGMYDRFSQVSQ